MAYSLGIGVHRRSSVVAFRCHALGKIIRREGTRDMNFLYRPLVPLLLLCLFSCHPTALHDEAASKVNEEQKSELRVEPKLSEWKLVTIDLLSTVSQSPARVHGKKATYRAPRARWLSEKDFGPVVTVFVTDRGQPWAGPESEFYIETDYGVVGGWIFAGNLIWCRSLITKLPGTKTDLDRLADHFQKQVSESDLCDAVDGGRGERTRASNTTALEWTFPDDFFGALTSERLQKTIRAAHVAGSTLRLELKTAFSGSRNPFRGNYNEGQSSPKLTTDSKATVWVDIKSRELLKVVVDNKQVFPRAERPRNSS